MWQHLQAESRSKEDDLQIVGGGASRESDHHLRGGLGPGRSLNGEPRGAEQADMSGGSLRRMPHRNEEASFQRSVIAISRSSERTADFCERHFPTTPELNSGGHASARVLRYRRVVTEHELKVFEMLDGCEDDGGADMVRSPCRSCCVHGLEEFGRSRSRSRPLNLSHEMRFRGCRGEVLLVLEGTMAAPPSESAEQLCGEQA